MLAVTILGNNSAIPAHGRHPTSQLITTADDLLLFDCGEGTQIQILNYRIKRSKINHIFISHLHGDHYFGLVGLLNSFALLSRTQPLHIYGPAPLIDVIELQFKLSETQLPYLLTFHPLEREGLLLDEKHYQVKCFRTSHRIECWGFKVNEKKNLRKVNAAAATSYGIPATLFSKIQYGEDVVLANGSTIANDLVSFPNVQPKCYVFCADTKYDERLIDIVKDADLMYHEATYTDAFREKAMERYHATTKQAASIALAGNVKKLLIGHFSAKFDTLDVFEQEAREVFEQTELALEGVTYLL